MSKNKIKKEFNINDYVVYPVHGVGKILSIHEKDILGQKKNCYLIEIQSNKMNINIPLESCEKIGLRHIIDSKELKKVITLLKKKQDNSLVEDDWKVRYQNNMNKLKSGSIYQVIEVCKSLFQRAFDKELSIMERKQYESSYNFIKSEIAYSKKLSMEESGDFLSQILLDNSQIKVEEEEVSDSSDTA